MFQLGRSPDATSREYASADSGTVSDCCVQYRQDWVLQMMWKLCGKVVSVLFLTGVERGNACKGNLRISSSFEGSAQKLEHLAAKHDQNFCHVSE